MGHGRVCGQGATPGGGGDSDDFTSGVIQSQALHDLALDFPSKVATFGRALYAVNARFEVQPGPDVAYQAIKLSR